MKKYLFKVQNKEQEKAERMSQTYNEKAASKKGIAIIN